MRVPVVGASLSLMVAVDFLEIFLLKYIIRLYFSRGYNESAKVHAIHNS